MYSFFMLICTLVAYGIEFFVNASFCLLIYNMFIMDLFNLPTISFWEMYGLVWFLQVLSGKVFDTFFNEILNEDKVNELLNGEDSPIATFDIDVSDDPDMKELIDKIQDKLKKKPKDKDEEEDDEDGED